MRRDVIFLIVDLTGKTFGRLTVISRAENDKHHCAQWNCLCSCGNKKVVGGQALRRGLTVSCGCYHKDELKKRLTTHGQSKTKLFREWQYMKRRCYQTTYKFYCYYGMRGIKVSDEWKEDFLAFKQWALSNGYEEGLTLDRIDPDGNYEPNNCRWVTRKEQMNNTRATHKYTINGETHSIAGWCEIYNVPHERVRRRVINEGWDILKALTTPALNRNGEPMRTI